MLAIPQEWKDCNTVTNYKKKGDKSTCGYSYGISLLSVAGKVLLRIMLSCLTTYIIEDILPETVWLQKRSEYTRHDLY